MAGPALALVAFVLFSLMDAVVKVLSARYPVQEIVLINALITVLVVPTLALRRGGLAQLRTRRPGLHLLRGCTGALTACAAFYAYSRIPLADAYAIIFTTPLLVTLLSVPLLREPVGWRRASAAGVGFVGVLIMLGGRLRAGSVWAASPPWWRQPRLRSGS